MKKPLVTLSLLACSAGCASWPGLDNPQISLAPYLTLYTLKGNARVQSTPGGTGNSAMPISQLGLGHRIDNLGGIVAIGDGFSGFQMNYFRLDMSDTTVGILSSPFGALLAGDTVSSHARMDEFRFGYWGQILDYETDSQLRLRLAPGLVVAHREMDFEAREFSGARTQAIHPADVGLPYLAGRLRLGYRQFSIDLDYAWNPSLEFGGDFKGTLQDFEAKAQYLFEDQDITVFAGYRHSDLPANGHEGGLDYAAQFRIDGFFVGVSFAF